MEYRCLITANAQTGMDIWKRMPIKNPIILTFDQNTAHLYQSFFPKVHCIQFKYGKIIYDKQDLFHSLRQFESDTDSLIADALQSDRHLGRGYYSGAPKFPRSYTSSKVNYWDSMAVIWEHIKTYDNLLTKVDIVLMSGVASMPTKLLCVCARKHNVPLRILRPMKPDDSYIWTKDEFRTACSESFRLKSDEVLFGEGKTPISEESVKAIYDNLIKNI